jgi:hypothetical protein
MCCCDIAIALKVLSQEHQWMTTQRQAKALVVGNDILPLCRLAQHWYRLVAFHRGEKRCWLFDAGDRPTRFMPMASERSQRTSSRQHTELTTI